MCTFEQEPQSVIAEPAPDAKENSIEEILVGDGAKNESPERADQPIHARQSDQPAK
jgi:hypothetical protein